MSNTRKGMDAHEPTAHPPEPDFQRVGSPQPLAGRFPEGTPKPVLEGLENPINEFRPSPLFDLPYQGKPQALGGRMAGLRHTAVYETPLAWTAIIGLNPANTRR